VTDAQAPAVGVVDELAARFPDLEHVVQPTADGIPTVWLPAARVAETLEHLKTGVERPYRMLYDLTAIDERTRVHREDQPASDFTVVYHLLSLERNADVRLKVALRGVHPQVATVTGLFPCAAWYEREVWDMFGIEVEGLPTRPRILMPPWWEGHPLRKEEHCRATERGVLHMPPALAAEWQDMMAFRPEDWGLEALAADPEIMFLNVGPQHGGTHGVLHIVIGLRDEEIVACVCDIGYHHRAQEKIGERQSWHTYIPYTDRVDYLGGVNNELCYLASAERLAGLEVPDRAKAIRVMLCELFRINSHLLYYGTFAQDIGALSPVFYMFSDRERVHDIVEAITGGRMHPGWFRLGGVAEDLPRGWDDLMREFLDYLRPRLDEYDHLVLDSRLTKARARGIGVLSADQAIEWGVTGPNLRSCGSDWDLRKKRPYSGYDWFDFEVPTATGGDSYDRLVVRSQEMRQSLRIIRQCLEHMPAGDYKSRQPLATPPIKEPGTMHSIETLIDHFLGVSWGPVVPPGEAAVAVEMPRGNSTYYLVSDGGDGAYRNRVRTPSFPHLQVLPLMTEGLEIPDLITILGSIDFVMADVDR
jgi:NADH-quinone oxidoreductase subunit C/D